jgi:large subunit ribosomal protein L23
MNNLDLMKVLYAPIVSEKASRVADASKQIAFKVAICANKLDIKKAVEMLFEVKVDTVTTLNM